MRLRLRRRGFYICASRVADAARTRRVPGWGRNTLSKLMEGVLPVEAYFDSLKSNDFEAEGGPVDHWFATCLLTQVETPNESVNRIPSHAEAVLDVRFPPPHTMAEMLEKIGGLLGPDLELETIVGAEPTHLAPDTLFCEVTELIGGEPVSLVKASGGSDSRFFREEDMPVNLSRPVVGELHSRREWIEIESMVTYYRICEEYLIRRLLPQHGG